MGLLLLLSVCFSGKEKRNRSFFCYVSGGWKPKHGVSSAWHLMTSYLRLHSMAKGWCSEKAWIFFLQKPLTPSPEPYSHDPVKLKASPALANFLIADRKYLTRSHLKEGGSFPACSLRGPFFHRGKDMELGREGVVARADGQLIPLICSQEAEIE